MSPSPHPLRPHVSCLHPPLSRSRAATVAMREAVARLAPSVHVLPWYNETLQRHSTHIGTRASCYRSMNVEVSSKRGTRSAAHVATSSSARRSAVGTVGGAPGTWRRSLSCACDCTHYCYTPLFYDAAFLTPFHGFIYKERTGTRASNLPRRAHGRAQGIRGHTISHTRQRRAVRRQLQSGTGVLGGSAQPAGS